MLPLQSSPELAMDGPNMSDGAGRCEGADDVRANFSFAPSFSADGCVARTKQLRAASLSSMDGSAGTGPTSAPFVLCRASSSVTTSCTRGFAITGWPGASVTSIYATEASSLVSAAQGSTARHAEGREVGYLVH